MNSTLELLTQSLRWIAILALQILFLVTSESALTGQQRQPEKDKDAVLRVVFFCPSDVEPPEGVKERLEQYIDYAQDFYSKWMKHWGYECTGILPVKRDADGTPEILFVKGLHTEASGAYRELGFQNEVINSACREHSLNPKGQVWWIFTYKGPEKRGFRGGGNARRGGISTAIYYPEAEANLKLEDHLGGPNVPKNAKACIHELGHALGLPHIGPVESDRMGNSLMGPIVKAFAARFPNEERVYLTKASAAMLWKHPLFDGSGENRDHAPEFTIKSFKVSPSRSRKSLVVRGSIETQDNVHSIVIAKESKLTQSEYWRKCYATRVSDDGSFEVEISELDRADGLLRIVCCFENGSVVGAESRYGLGNGFVKQYSYQNGKYEFEKGWSSPKTSIKGRGDQRRRRPSARRTAPPRRSGPPGVRRLR